MRSVGDGGGAFVYRRRNIIVYMYNIQLLYIRGLSFREEREKRKRLQRSMTFEVEPFTYIIIITVVKVYCCKSACYILDRVCMCVVHVYNMYIIQRVGRHSERVWHRKFARVDRLQSSDVCISVQQRMAIICT